MGDEFGRTDHGNNNAYNQDNEISWVDWRRRGQARRPRALRRRTAHPPRPPHGRSLAPIGGAPTSRFYGAKGRRHIRTITRSLVWCIDGLYVMSNSWWEPVPFLVQAPGPWTVVVDTTTPPPLDIRTDAAAEGEVVDAGSLVNAEARSVVVLERPRPG